MPTHKRLKLGFDNYSIRALGWKAPRLLDYAASLELDAILLSDPDVFESRDASYLKEIGAKARALGVEIHVGMLSVCPSSVLFDPSRGTAEQQLSEVIRMARLVGSPVARCVLGNVNDRRSKGGIEARMAEVVKVLKKVRNRALDSGAKIAVENHAGDLQSWELVALIEEAGNEFVGVTMDSGNATWALEDPLDNLEVLGPYALTTGIRDSAVWETPDGATLQWTAMGEGAVNWKRYFKRYAELCSDAPVMLEIISGRHIAIPYLHDDFWDAYPKARPREFAGFLRLARDGRPRKPFTVRKGIGPKRAEREFQLAELDRSIRYCKKILRLGLK